MNPLSFERRQRHLARALVISLTLSGLLVACQKKKEAPPEPAPAPAAAAPAPPKPPAAPKPAVKGLEWEDPKDWKRVKPSSSMRRASYEIPPVKGDKVPAELNVFVLGGDIDSNIQRWIDEFSGFDPKTLVRSDRTVNDLQQAIVELPKGKFSGGMNTNTVSENFGLLGAIVVMPSGAKYFFKLTGPSATVKAARKPFYALLDSAKIEGGTKIEGATPGGAPVPGGGAVPAASATGAVAPAAVKTPAGDAPHAPAATTTEAKPASPSTPSTAGAGGAKP